MIFQDRAPGFNCGRIAASKNTGLQEFREPQSGAQPDYKKKKPGRARLFDELPF
jgi:hypothetical protein